MKAAATSFVDGVPSRAEMRAIVELRDPALRNLRITLAYHQLTLAMARCIGHESVSWCAHATWASRTAGRFIRGELPGPGTGRTWGGLGRLPVTAGLRDVYRAVGVRHVSTHVATGNLIVFEEIGPFFADLVELLSRSGGPSDHERQWLADRFEPGSVLDGGQDLLRAAFGHYYEAAFLPDGKAKSELVFLSNALIGLHEQTRLQPPIASALRLGLLRHEVLLLARQLSRHTDRLFARLERWFREVSTRWLMALELPEMSVALGADVGPLPDRVSMFPAPLRRLENGELRSLLYELDRTPNTTLGSAASDWTDLGDRMNFVVDLFRAHHQDPSLYRAPFSPGQVETIRAGRIPSGPL